MKKQIIIGVESFEKMRENDYFYIDKTLFIRELLEKRGEVTLITRPRRFGKTLNMSMLRSFFDINKNSKSLFDGLEISKYIEICEKHQNQYPVISFTLKNVEERTYENALHSISNLVSTIFQDSMYLLESSFLNEFEKKMFYKYCSMEATESELRTAFLFLATCLYKHHQKRVIILLDEYDTPIDSSERYGYYDEMIGFMRGFLGSAFKTNNALEFGVLTGVQRISKEGLFSSFNNPKICGVLDDEFSSCFGFTEDEVIAACEMYEISEKYDEIKSWYDGYRFGGQDMYNPWSITMYIDSQKLQNYWVNTGSVGILRDVFHKGDDRLRNDLAGLLTGSPIKMSLADQITYPIKYVGTNTFWTLLLHAGYLKPCNGANGAIFEAELVNMEVKDTFSRYAMEWLREERETVSDSIQEFVSCLLNGDADGVSRTLNDDILHNPSSFDLVKENSYHMFIYGMLLAASNSYTVRSNQESGKGRADCLIKPNDKTQAAVVVEFKHLRDDQATAMKEEAQKALEQIEEKAYIHTLKQEGYTRVYKYAIAFNKKTCEVVMVD
ncbi:MAG: ATP-binding protein [Oscillospiraceae bacterium]|nr:ATP-binding protein [Oscillospiraceae bacterium]